MEYYSKCNVCGKITCYTDKDLKDNNRQSLIAGLAAISTIGNAVAGNRYDMYESSKLSDRVSNKIKDYSKCPNCGSKDLTLVTKKFAIFSNKVNGNYSVEGLIKEANNFLEKKDYENAFCFATMILNEDEKNYNAYLIRFLSSYEVNSLEEIDELNVDYSNNQHFNNLLSVANETQKRKLLFNSQKNKYNYIVINSTNLLAKKDDQSIIEDLDYYICELKNYDNEKSKKLLENLKLKRKEILYKLGCEYLEQNNKDNIIKAIDIFDKLDDYKDSKINAKKGAKQLYNCKKQHNKSIIIASICIFSLIIIVITSSIITNNNRNEEMYKQANSLMKEKKYEEAIKIYEELDDYKDSKKNKENAQKYKKYNDALESYKKGYFAEAAAKFDELKNYKDSLELSKKAKLYYKIDNYCEYQDYFTRNFNDYELVDNDKKLNNLFPNNYFAGYLSLACTFSPEYNIVNSDGTISKPDAKGSRIQYSWAIKDSHLFYNITHGNYRDDHKFEVRKIFDDTYLLYLTNAKNEKVADLILVLENSDTATKVGFKRQ